MDSEKKLAFLHKIAKLGLDHIAHYDGGGVIGNAPSTGSGSTAGSVNNTVANTASNVNGGQQTWQNATSAALSPVAGIGTAFGAALTAQNQFNAAAPTQIGTVGSQQATLANQLQNEAAGNGPNPAQLQYQQNAQQIAQQQAALAAQNRAINPGLAARQAATAGTNAQQQAAGQAAAQQAQQQITAQQQLAGLTGQEQQGALAAQGINAQTAQANANAVNQTEGGILSSIGSIVGLAHGGEVRKHYDDGGQVTNPFQVPNFSQADYGGAQVPELPTPSKSSGLSLAHGGEVQSWLGHYINKSKMHGGGHIGAPMKHYDDGGQISDQDMSNKIGTYSGMHHGESGPSGSSNIGSVPTADLAYRLQGEMHPQERVHIMSELDRRGVPTSNYAKGGKVPSMVSPGEEILSPKQAKKVAEGKADPLKVGERVKGKAKVKGDSEENDTVPKMLKDGGMVIPRSIVKMHPEKAAEFVRNHLSKKGMGLK